MTIRTISWLAKLVGLKVVVYKEPFTHKERWFIERKYL